MVAGRLRYVRYLRLESGSSTPFSICLCTLDTERRRLTSDK